MRRIILFFLIFLLFSVSVVSALEVKWSQPPQLNPSSPYPGCYWGWDELSIYEGPQIVGDDWLCNDQRPVVAIRWWGSYLGWDLMYAPPIVPDAFHLAIWTDVPAGGSEPFSHPDFLIWEVTLPYLDVNEVVAGCDYYPGHFMDTCFQYDVLLDPAQWFFQPPMPNVYWLTISAIYSVPPVANEWGWKTREHFFNDAAIRIFDPLIPTVGSVYVLGEPIEAPAGVAWDLAFELFTEDSVTATPTNTPVATNTPEPTDTPEPTATETPSELPTNTPTATIIPTITPFPDDMKWSQEPQLNPLSPYPDCFWGWDEVSIFSQYQIAADDWLCVDDRPVTGIRWWGSYLGWDLPISPPIVPDFFHLGIWTDVPAGGTEPFSHPDWMIWETVVPYPLVMEIPVGCDYYPGYAYDTCFEYYYQIPEMEWFYQEPGPTVYWLSVSAIYSIPPGVNEWGWKTREHYFNDAAVRIFMPTAPGLGASYVAGEPIEEPVGTPWDLSFQILTTAIPTTIPTATPTYPPTATPTTDPTSTPYPIPSVDGRGMSLLIIILTLLIFVTGFRLHQ